MKFRERQSHRCGKSAFSTHKEYFTNNHIIYPIVTYNFSDFTIHILFYFIFSTRMSSANQGDGLIEVTCGSKKRKASNSPTLRSQPKSGSSESPLRSPVRPKPYFPAIISGAEEKFKSWRKLMSELRQYHPSLKIQESRNFQTVIL